MFRHRKAVSIIFVLYAVGAVFADAEKVGDHNIGIGAGFITGYGLSYRQWFSRFGLQCTAAPFYFSGRASTSSMGSIGLTALVKIKEARYVNLIAYGGPHYNYYRNTSRPPFSSYESDDKLFIGCGPGLDFHFLNLSFTLMFGYCFRYAFTTKDYGTNFSGECGFHYSF